jgi:hypothetical protein
MRGEIKMAEIANPELKDLEPLVGKWNIELRFPMDPPGTVHTTASFEWIEDGAFLKMDSGEKGKGTPHVVCVIGRDNDTETYTMLYLDNRGVSRIYNMSFKGGEWKQWRESPDFWQRFTGVLSPDGNTITAKWENSKDGVDWKHDFDLIYTRI